jgi:hypothetical protein
MIDTHQIPFIQKQQWRRAPVKKAGLRTSVSAGIVLFKKREGKAIRLTFYSSSTRMTSAQQSSAASAAQSPDPAGNLPSAMFPFSRYFSTT